MPFDERVSHYAKRGSEIIDSDREAKSKAEKYTFSRISKGNYACETGKAPGDEGYLIRVIDDRIGCSCSDMTFNCKGNEICKHIIRFLAMGRVPENIAPDWITGFLRGMGWTGLEPTPPEVPKIPADQPMDSLGVDDPLPEPPKAPEPRKDNRINRKSEPKPEPPAKITATCPHCMIRSLWDTQEQADAWLKTHLPTCKDNPNKSTKEPAKKLTAKCQYCGKEISRVRPNDLKTAIEAHEAKCKDRPKEPPKGEVLVTQDAPTTPSTDVKMPSDAKFQQAAVGRYLENQGGMYTVADKQIPDSAAVQNYAISQGVSTEVLKIEQTPGYALTIVRAHLGSRYVDASVLVRRDAMIEKFQIDMAERHPDWVVGWSNGSPEFDLNKRVTIGKKTKLLGLYLAGAIADKWLFMPRENETKSTRRAQVKILGSDWREDSEVESEREEVETVNKTAR